ncbi:hypothetical protein DPX16_0871 [Anabarilius grahami]|uniref:C-type lectin domain-containing protein n=1 Tax=Anabarilius grahami TaxID=495550 RepID=A0A3N0Y440_ANAGA|nr:hypothetical protein DPX16_0871 [Anabarilius grahami]
MNWTNAQKYCRQHYSDLATVDDQADHDELLKTVGMGHVWLGLSRTTYPGPYVWSDQIRVAPHSQNGFLENRTISCVLKLTTVFARKRQIVKLEVKSSQNLNDPGVMDKILLKMEQILKEKGVTEYAKLSWRTQSDGNVFQKKEQKEK